MDFPTDIELHETQTATTWLGKDGILYSVAKAGVQHELKHARENLALLKKLSGNKPVAQICDISAAHIVTAQASRFYGGAEYGSFLLASALITRSIKAKVNARFMTTLVSPAFPSAEFNSVDDARSWLAEVLTTSQ